ncbi:MAG: DUF488 domain-containing protein [Actinomycetota bacterium]|nr:DUF488 domain-containing protein [Actinomycetota bacterium]
MLLDVRLNAISRKPGFSKKRLTAALAAVGIGYRHARALGNPRDNREPFHSADPRPGTAGVPCAACGRRRWGGARPPRSCSKQNASRCSTSSATTIDATGR